MSEFVKVYSAGIDDFDKFLLNQQVSSLLLVFQKISYNEHRLQIAS